MYRVTPLGITCVTIDVLFFTVIESEWALHRKAIERPEGADWGEVDAPERDYP